MSFTIQQLIQHSQLVPAQARLLLRTLLGVTPAWLLTHDHETVTADTIARFEAWVQRRKQGEPIAYLVAQREFYSRNFYVDPAVLIPRPETEHLVELALALATPQARVLDLGTGCGNIAISLKLERPDLQVVASDISAAALAVAAYNTKQLQAPVQFVQADWLNPWAADGFDVIVSNPPYIAHNDLHLLQAELGFEPQGALTDYGDGLRHLRRVIEQAPHHLQLGGWLLLEHGYAQATACRALLQQVGLSQVNTWRDLAGLERISGGQKGF